MVNVTSCVKSVLPAAFLSLCAALFTTNTWAEDMWTRDKLTGDWGGLRSDLTKHGIDIDLRLTQYYQAVTDGGRDTNDEYGGTMDYRVKLEGDKLFGTWEGFWIDMHGRSRWGDDIGADAGGMTIPNTGMLMPLPDDY